MTSSSCLRKAIASAISAVFAVAEKPRPWQLAQTPQR